LICRQIDLSLPDTKNEFAGKINLQEESMDQQVENNREELEPWLEMVEDRAYSLGEFYVRGVNTCRSLGIVWYPELEDRLDKAIDRQTVLDAERRGKDGSNFYCIVKKQYKNLTLAVDSLRWSYVAEANLRNAAENLASFGVETKHFFEGVERLKFRLGSILLKVYGPDAWLFIFDAHGKTSIKRGCYELQSVTECPDLPRIADILSVKTYATKYSWGTVHIILRPARRGTPSGVLLLPPADVTQRLSSFDIWQPRFARLL
jgi:hypothetical protein